MGYQAHIHSNGDATSDVILDAIEDVLAADPRDDHRHTLIHCQMLTALSYQLILNQLV